MTVIRLTEIAVRRSFFFFPYRTQFLLDIEIVSVLNANQTDRSIL